MNKVISFFKRPGGGQSFEALVAPHIDSLYRRAYQYTGAEADAEDLLQELLTELYCKKEKLFAVENLGPWLKRCLYHRFIDYYRRQKRTSMLEDIDSQNISKLLTSGDHAHHHMLRDQILKGLDSITEAQRVVIVEHDINGSTLGEIESLTGIPVGTIKSHLHRGRKALKKYITLQPFEDQMRV